VEASSCPLPTGVALSAAVVRFFTSESFFFSLSSPENHSLTLFVVVISTSVFILLIFNFCS